MQPQHRQVPGSGQQSALVMTRHPPPPMHLAPGMSPAGYPGIVWPYRPPGQSLIGDAYGPHSSFRPETLKAADSILRWHALLVKGQLHSALGDAGIGKGVLGGPPLPSRAADVTHYPNVASVGSLNVRVAPQYGVTQQGTGQAPQQQQQHPSVQQHQLGGLQLIGGHNVHVAQHLLQQQAGGVNAHGALGLGTIVPTQGGPGQGGQGGPHDLSGQSIPVGSLPQQIKQTTGGQVLYSTNQAMYAASPPTQQGPSSGGGQPQFYTQNQVAAAAAHQMQQQNQNRQMQQLQQSPIQSMSGATYGSYPNPGGYQMYQAAPSGYPHHYMYLNSQQLSQQQQQQFQMPAARPQPSAQAQFSQPMPTSYAQQYSQMLYPQQQYAPPVSTPMQQQQQQHHPMRYTVNQQQQQPPQQQHQVQHHVVQQSQQPPPPRAKNRLEIVDPATGKDILKEMESSAKPAASKSPSPDAATVDGSTSAASMDESAPVRPTEASELAAQFAADVAKRAADPTVCDDSETAPVVPSISRTSVPPPPSGVGASVVYSDGASDSASVGVPLSATLTVAPKQQQTVSQKYLVPSNTQETLSSVAVSLEAIALTERKTSEPLQVPEALPTVLPYVAPVVKAELPTAVASSKSVPPSANVPEVVSIPAPLVDKVAEAVPRPVQTMPSPEEKKTVAPVTVPTPAELIPSADLCKPEGKILVVTPKEPSPNKSVEEKPVNEVTNRLSTVSSATPSVSTQPALDTSEATVAAMNLILNEPSVCYIYGKHRKPTVIPLYGYPEDMSRLLFPDSKGVLRPYTDHLMDSTAGHNHVMENHEPDDEEDDSDDDSDEDEGIGGEEPLSKQLRGGLELKYSYVDGQWSPVNQAGKRQYDRSFLMQLQNDPLSRKKPEALPNLEVVRDGPGGGGGGNVRNKSFDNRGPMKNAMMSHGNDFTPNYVKSTGSGNKMMTSGHYQFNSNTSLQQQNKMGGRGSQQGRQRGPGSQQRVIVLNIPTEVKLHTTQNAWKPSVKEENKETDEEKTVTEAVLKKMRGILNKLTPEKFEKLIGSVKVLQIDNYTRLSAVIDLVFEKAVEEQSFSSMYAHLCELLGTMNVSKEDGGGEVGEASEAAEAAEKEKGTVKFRNLIINKCQREYEREAADDVEREEKLKEIEACTNNETKMELLAKLEYNDTKLRKRSVGNIRFIGELYKLRVLTSVIMMRIIGTLITKRDEESLECLCKLLTTIGKILETQCERNKTNGAMESLESHFNTMSNMVDGKDAHPINSRVRFLMMDVIDLRNNNWVPRREDANPKTKKQVHEDLIREEQEQQMALAQQTPRSGGVGDRDRRARRGTPEDGGWSTVTKTTRTLPPFDSSKLASTVSRVTPQSGSDSGSSMSLRPGMSSWGRGSSGGLKDAEGRAIPPAINANRFNVLTDGGAAATGDKTIPDVNIGRLGPGGGHSWGGAGYASKSMPPPSSSERESLLSTVKNFSGPHPEHSRSRPQSRDTSLTRSAVSAEPMQVAPPKLVVCPEVPNGSVHTTPTHLPEVNVEEIKKKILPLLEEYLSVLDIKDAVMNVRENFTNETLPSFVSQTIELVADNRHANKRQAVGRLFADLMQDHVMTTNAMMDGAKVVVQSTEDTIIDVPQVLSNFADIFAPCIGAVALTLNQLLEIAEVSGCEKWTAQIFGDTLAKFASASSIEAACELWRTSGMQWSTIVPGDIPEFLAQHHLEFLTTAAALQPPMVTNNHMSNAMQTQQAELLRLFAQNSSNDDVFRWIDGNVDLEDISNKTQLVRALISALVESQVLKKAPMTELEEWLVGRAPLLRKYIDLNLILEVQCVFALQALSVKHQHPSGLLEKALHVLYDCDILTAEAFEQWELSKDPEELDGKGVCVSSLQRLLQTVKENVEPEDSPAP